MGTAAAHCEARQLDAAEKLQGLFRAPCPGPSPAGSGKKWCTLREFASRAWGLGDNRCVLADRVGAMDLGTAAAHCEARQLAAAEKLLRLFRAPCPVPSPAG